MSGKLIFDQGREGRTGYSLPPCDVPKKPLEELVPGDFLREKEPELPEVSEIEIVRHFTELSTYNHGVDTGFYPLGSCTMKYNTKIAEELARLGGFARLHPYQPEDTVQGILELMHELGEDLATLAGMDKTTLQPTAGAHGEMVGVLIIRAYHLSRGETKRNKVIVPDSAHGTNPATASMAGFKTVEVASDEKGEIDVEELKKLVDDETAAIMVTNPNTLGLFEKDILEISKIVHDAGGLVYYDGANANAIFGYATPGDMGCDVIHFNLHKTFSTPHGCGGPGGGPVVVKEFLEPFLPIPVVEKKSDGSFFLDYDRPQSIGRAKAYYGPVGVAVKAYAYLKALGAEGLKEVSEIAVLNANYLRKKITKNYNVPFDRICKHEFIANPKELKKEYGVITMDIAKRLLDYGVHPPTVYFPLIVEETMMIEPTETETKETLDEFIEVLDKIAEEVRTDAQLVKEAPYNTVVRRLDDVTASRQPVVRWQKEEA